MKEIFKKIIAKILELEARIFLRRHPDTKIILVGGNIGKTSTKDAVFEALKASKKTVRKSAKSFNSELGLPLTILALPNAWSNIFMWTANVLKGFLLALFAKAPDILVLELGADKKGDLSRVVSWLKADILILTYIPQTPVHVERFKNKEELFDEKRQLLKSLKEDSVLVYDKDSKLLREFVEDFKGRKLSFALSQDADFLLSKPKAKCKDGKAESYFFEIKNGELSYKFEMRKNIGSQQARPLAAAMASAEALGLELNLVSEKLKKRPRSKGRMSLLKGKLNSMILDDTYNSSPKAALAALDTLGDFACIKGKKIAVLGDMLELGKFAAEAHKEVLERAISLADEIFLMGPLFKEASKAFPGTQFRIYEKREWDKLSDDLLRILSDKDLILLKASQSMRFEKIAAKLLAPEINAKEVLVRQEEAWLNR